MPIYSFGSRKPKIDPTAWIFPTAVVIGKVIIGPEVYVGAGAVIRGDYGKIVIKEGTAVEENVTIHARPGGKTLIEEDVTIGHMAMIHNCTLKKNCVIGMSAVISDYAEIGEGAIIGEGSVVKARSKISPNTIAVGIPAVEKGEVGGKMEFWIGAKQIYRDLCKQYPRKLKEIKPLETVNATKSDSDENNSD